MHTPPGPVLPFSPRSPSIPSRVARIAGTALLALLSAGGSLTAATHITIEAGDHDRGPSIVQVPWSGGDADWRISDNEMSLPLQIDGNRAWCILPALKRGEVRRYALHRIETPVTGDRGVSARRTENGVDLHNRGQHVLTYVAGPGQLPNPAIDPILRRGGYLHPVRTPAGRVVTDDYPPNHLHHHGFWSAWTRTEFQGRRPDFWNMGGGSGRVDSEAVEARDQGPVFAALTASHSHTDLLAQPPVVVLRETWTVRLFGTPDAVPFAVFDLELEQQCATEAPLRLPRYYYGGLGFRGRWEWNGAENVRYLDANGRTGRVDANETRARWYWMGGMVDGALVGIAMLGHPENFRAPQPLRVHPTEPFICWAPSQAGDWEIRPEEPYRARYRVIVLDGEPDAALFDRLWNDYAHPPVTRVE